MNIRSSGFHGLAEQQIDKFDNGRLCRGGFGTQAVIKFIFIYLCKVGINVNLCASFGVASYPDDATDLRELLSLADEAMFSVKEHGKNSVRGIT